MCELEITATGSSRGHQTYKPQGDLGGKNMRTFPGAKNSQNAAHINHTLKAGNSCFQRPSGLRISVEEGSRGDLERVLGAFLWRQTGKYCENYSLEDVNRKIYFKGKCRSFTCLDSGDI